MAAGLVKGEGFAVDASVMEANASRYHGKAPDEIAWAEPERQTRAVKEYLAARIAGFVGSTLMTRFRITRQMQLDFLRQPAPYYSEIGRPSVDPDLMIRMLIVGYCYGLRLQPLVHIGERRHHKTIDTPQQVVLRDAIIEMELIEKACLIAAPPTHHRRLRERDP